MDEEQRDAVVIRVHLPQPMGKVNELLQVLSQEWPKAKLNFSGERGWEINLEPEP